MNGHIYFEIHADNPQRAANFYSEVFGWSFDKAEDTPVEYWRITTGGSRGGLLKRSNKTPPPGCGTNAFVCSVEVNNFDQISEKITDRGGQIIIPKFWIPKVCWQGYFNDTENNIFGIFQVDPSAIFSA